MLPGVDGFHRGFDVLDFPPDLPLDGASDQGEPQQPRAQATCPPNLQAQVRGVAGGLLEGERAPDRQRWTDQPKSKMPVAHLSQLKAQREFQSIELFPRLETCSDFPKVPLNKCEPCVGFKLVAFRMRFQFHEPLSGLGDTDIDRFFCSGYSRFHLSKAESSFVA